MDSKVVNRWIRQHAWPVLREAGFTKFEARRAWRQRDPFVDVVTFESFRTYDVVLSNLTTYSFRVRLGVHVRDGLWYRDWPTYPECPLQSGLAKRSPVDGFDDPDIFYVDPQGHTLAAVFEEVRALLEHHALPWFAHFAHLPTVTDWIRQGFVSPTPPLAMAHLPSPGCLVADEHLACLLLLQLEASPTEALRAEACAVLDHAVGEFFKLPVLAGRVSVAWEIKKLFTLLRRLNLAEEATGPGEFITTREAVWPTLKSAGFTEFADRLAHRPTPHAVHTVALLPADVKGQLRLGLGIYWPALEECNLVRRNKRGEPRPRLEECHLHFWPASLEGLAWFSSITSTDWWSDPDWRILLRWPTMHGHGAHNSCRRALLRAALAHALQQTEEADWQLAQAQEAIAAEHPLEQPRYFAWLNRVREALNHPTPSQP